MNNEILSGKDALIALANGEDVQLRQTENHEWESADGCIAHHFKKNSFEFRVKPRVIKINGFDVPAPFNPNFGEDYFWINPSSKEGFSCDIWANEESDQYASTFGVWRTENEIKQVVTAYRKSIGDAND